MSSKLAAFGYQIWDIFQEDNPFKKHLKILSLLVDEGRMVLAVLGQGVVRNTDLLIPGQFSLHPKGSSLRPLHTSSMEMK